MIKVCAIVVTYNRKNSLFRCLSCIKAQDYEHVQILVVDNDSTDGTYEHLKILFPEVRVLRLPENLGGSGGFSRGMSYAYEYLDFDWCVLLDDDAYMEKDSISSVVKHALSGNNQNNALVSRSTESVLRDSNENLEQIDHGMFVGFYVSKSTINKIGLPREDYFIYWDDVEYSHRIRQNGGNIYLVSKSVIFHKDWSQRDTKKHDFIGLTFDYPDVPNWRMYYLVRNSFHYQKDSGRVTGEPLKSGIKYLVKSVLVRRDHSTKILWALIHGITGLRGKTVAP